MPRSNPKPAPRPQSGSGRSGFIRLISGQWKGRKLPVREVEGLRPTTDRIKETLFNWLAAEVRDSRCLDLFAGSGSLGFEALSRYARHVTMVEMDKGAAQQLSKNLSTLQSQQATIIQRDALSLLAEPGEPFDIIFLDPPFRRDLLDTVCQRLESGGWLSDDALIYIEREREGGAPQLPTNWHLLKDKQAGQVCYQLYQRESTAP